MSPRRKRRTRRRKADPSGSFNQLKGSRGVGKYIAGVALAAAIGLGWIVFFKPDKPSNATITSTGEQGIEALSNEALAVSVVPDQIGASTNGFTHLPEEESMTDPEIGVHLLNQGNELLEQGKNEQAVEMYRHALQHDPGSEDTHYNIAIALARSGRDEEAIEHYEETLRIFPDYAEAHNNLGNLLVKESRFDEAIKHFEESLEINPDSSSTHNNYGKALALQGKTAEATVHFAKAVQMVPDYVEAHYNLGNAYLSLNRTDEAMAQFKTVLRLRPGFAPALQALARAQQKQSLQLP